MGKKLKKLIKKEEKIWHDHFVPSLIAALSIAFLSFIYDFTLSNIVLFASIGGSAAILTNSKSHKLTSLRTTIFSYIIAIIISIAIYGFDQLLPLNISFALGITLFLVTISLFLFNSFHPPAITAALSFVILERSIYDLMFLFVAVIFIFIIIRLITYTLYQGLSVKSFIKEFKKEL